MDYSNNWTAFVSDSDEISHFLKVSINKSLGTVDWVDPDCNILCI